MTSEKSTVNGLFFKHCSHGNYSYVQELLKRYEIDITNDNDGGVFPILFKNNNIGIIRLIIKYYEKNRLQYDSNSLEYKIAFLQLQHSLEAAMECCNEPSEEIKEIISKYLPKYLDEDIFTVYSEINILDETSQYEKFEELNEKVEEHNPLPLNETNLRTLSYETNSFKDLINIDFWNCNLISQKALSHGEIKICRTNIEEAMKLISEDLNENYVELKARVIYNYIKYLHKSLKDVENMMINKSFFINEIINHIKTIIDNEFDYLGDYNMIQEIKNYVK